MRDLRGWLLPAEVGRRLGISTVRVKQLEAAGRIRSRRAGTYRFFEPAEVARFAAERARKRAAQTGAR